MADTQHTPTPWSIGRRRWITGGNVDIARIHSVSKIGEAEAVANAEFIIGACNSHDALLAALTQLMEWEGNEAGSYSEDDTQQRANEVWQDAFDAIAKARGEVTND